MSKLRYIELFGGIGACTQALKRLGIETELVDYVEIDKYAVKSFNAMNSTNFEPQDITTWNKNFNDIDLIIHGSPCQDFSVAGKQQGGDKDSGTRSSLMYETIRIVGTIKPKYVIWENVKNLLSKKHRHNFDKYLELMEELGYTNYYQVLNAKDYGIPQNRERVFTISILGNEHYEFPKNVETNCEVINPLKGTSGKSWQFEQNVYSENSLLRSLKAGGGSGNIPKIIEHYEFPPKQELKLKLKDLLEDEVDEKYYLSDKMFNYCMGTNQKESKFPRKERFLQSLTNTNEKGIANTVSTNAGNRPVDNFIVDERNLKQLLCDKLIKNNKVTEFDVIRHSYSNARMKEWETRGVETNNEIPTLGTRCDCLGVVVKDNFITKKYKKFQKENGYVPEMFNPYNSSEIKDVAPTQTIQCGSTTSSATILKNDGLRIRKLTPKECWRLMGFNDEVFEKAEKVNSNAQLYKQAGNSIVVNVLVEILRGLL